MRMSLYFEWTGMDTAPNPHVKQCKPIFGNLSFLANFIVSGKLLGIQASCLLWTHRFTVKNNGEGAKL